MNSVTNTVEKFAAEAIANLERAVTELEAERVRITADIDTKIKEYRGVIARLRGEDAGAVVEPSRTPSGQISILGDSQPAGRPRGRAQRAAYEYLLAHPGIGYRDLVIGLEGEYTELGYNKARNMIRALKEGLWLEGEPGAWRLGDGSGSFAGSEG